MKKYFGKVGLYIFLIFLSAVLYGIHYYIFHDLHHIGIYTMGDIAFLPLEILFVTLIFHKILNDQEKKNRWKKLNMVIGIFFSEVGNQLLAFFVLQDTRLHQWQHKLMIGMDWEKKDFQKALQEIEEQKIDLQLVRLEELKQLLILSRPFLLKMLENPALLERELFSNLMMAVFHLGEELSLRDDIEHLSEADQKHLGIDISRVYRLLLQDWIVYAQHLKNEYPFLYSFTVRTNPFDPNAQVEVK